MHLTTSHGDDLIQSQALDDQREGLQRSRPLSQLAIEVRAPALEGASIQQRATAFAATGDGSRVVDLGYHHGCRRVLGAAVPKLTGVVRAPARQSRIAESSAAVRISDAD